MDSGRAFRAIVMVVTLLGCLWVLNRLETKQTPPVAAPVDTTKSIAPVPLEHAANLSVSVPEEISTLPLISLDNTCYYDSERDFSSCTGAISGGPMREYIFRANGRDTFFVSAEPRSDFFDLSLIVVDHNNHCVIGQDEHGPGFREFAQIAALARGTYTLYVGGYAQDCGPYELTISNQAPAIAQVTKLESLSGRNGTVVRWETFAEVALEHFDLFRQDGTQRERIATFRAHGSRAGFASYRFTDRHPRPDSNYVIEAVAKDGRREVKQT